MKSSESRYTYSSPLSCATPAIYHAANKEEASRMLKYLLICLLLLLPVAMQANENEKLNAVLNYHQISERIGTGGQRAAAAAI